jgi:hypothetical protein
MMQRMNDYLIVLGTVYGTVGLVAGLLLAGIARGTGTPWYIVPFIFVGGVLTWPLALIQFVWSARDNNGAWP